MSIRKGYSDSKLIQHLAQGPKSKFDDDNLDNFLPKFLIKDMNTKDESKLISKDEELDVNEIDNKSIFDRNESENINEYLRQMSIKEVKLTY